MPTRQQKQTRRLHKKPPHALPGAVCVQYVTGKDGIKRGPYHARMWRERGRLRKMYVRRRDVSAVSAACARWHQERRDERQAQLHAALRYDRMTVRQLIAELRRLEAAWS
jgi:hypothetical protein